MFVKKLFACLVWMTCQKAYICIFLKKHVDLLTFHLLPQRNDEMMKSASLNDENKIINYKLDLFYDKSWI